MTEEEAKTKWCPHAVASHTDPRAGFRDDDGGRPKVHPCIGSACMAWRWGGSWPRPDDPPEIRSFYDGGFCGLAGKP